MSPVARSRGHVGRAFAVSVAAIGLLIAVAAGVAILGSRGDVDLRLGDETFGGQRADRLAEEIDRDGPILYSDVAGGSRDIYLQHLGDDPYEGWLVFAARPPDAPRECTIRWVGDEDVFRLLDEEGGTSGACDGTEFPPDGEGLPHYPVEVRGEHLEVDLNPEQRGTSTTR